MARWILELLHANLANSLVPRQILRAFGERVLERGHTGCCAYVDDVRLLVLFRVGTIRVGSRMRNLNKRQAPRREGGGAEGLESRRVHPPEEFGGIRIMSSTGTARELALTP